MKEKKFGKIIVLMKDEKPVTNINWNEAKELAEKNGLRLATFEETLELNKNKKFKEFDEKYFFWTDDVCKNESPKEKYRHLNRKDVYLYNYKSNKPVIRNWLSVGLCVYANADWDASVSGSSLSALYVKLDEKKPKTKLFYDGQIQSLKHNIKLMQIQLKEARRLKTVIK